MAAGFGLLGFAPAVLWAMTPREFAAALRGRLGPVPDGPPDKTAMQAMMRSFPD